MNIAKIELWLLRSAAIAAVLAGLFVRGCYYGEARTQAAWDASIAEARTAQEKQNAQNRKDEADRQARVLVAEAATKQAQLDLAAYRRSHPVSVLVGGVCQPTAQVHPAGSGQGTVDSPATGTGETARLLQPPVARDIGSDLDVLMAEADSINDSYGICLATRPQAQAKGDPP